MNWRPSSGTPGQSDPASFSQAVLPHLDAAYRLARWLTQDKALAEDVAQDAMLRAWRYFASFRGDDARAWLLRIVRNTAITTLMNRKPAAAPLELAADLPDPADDPERALHRQQERAELQRALAALPLELRECLVLRELEELSYKQIAQITGTPIGTVMSRLWRARQALLGHASESPCHAR